MDPLKIEKRKARVMNVNLGNEKHGDEHEKRADVTVVFSAAADELRTLFGPNPDKVFDALWDSNGMPAAGSWVMSTGMKLEDIKAKISRLSFEGCRIKAGATLNPGINRTFVVSAKIQLYPGNKDCADTLWALTGEETTITLEVPQLELDLDTPADEAERPPLKAVDPLTDPTQANP